MSKRRMWSAALALIGAMGSVAIGLAPASADAYADWDAVSAGEYHTCAIRVGRIYCWGDNDHGQLGNGSVGAVVKSPHLIKSSATDWKAVSAGQDHTCAIRVGRVACWGSNGSGQLGDGFVGGSNPTPHFMNSGATDWTRVDSGQGHTCAIRVGRVACWGSNTFGQLGDGSAPGTTNPSPHLIKSDATDWTAVSAGAGHTCALRAGRIACWGYNVQGQLGGGTSGGLSATPQLIKSGATDWAAVTAGGGQTCALRSGLVACWGSTQYGESGDGVVGGSFPYANGNPHVISSSATDWKLVAAGHQFTCAIRVGRVACWGINDHGQQGIGSTSGPIGTPHFTKGVTTGWTSVTAGTNHACAINGKRIYCWGANDYGQLGLGSGTPHYVPTLVGLPSSSA